MPEIFRYGPYPSNFTEIHPASGPHIRGTIAMLHGGWWRSRFDLHLMDDLCQVLAAQGWRVGNVEFRRTEGQPGDDGGWPRTFDDVSLALEKRAPVPNGKPTVAIGHSAGGHLALLAAKAGLVDAAVALAPITDLEWCQRDGLGEGATDVFLGVALEHAKPLHAECSPTELLPLGRPHLVVHGTRDTRVPVDQSRRYVERARTAGDRVDYIEAPEADHFQVIEPDYPVWAAINEWLEGVRPVQQLRSNQ
ncbi:alpha/beta fold hydrolase [Nocardia sp. R6R-6]|uniref:alpha/beta fold hydrolase n=1 Tax=Nocardia sp. R6R-6 TaxID=3459303 RepID=UPI00403D90FF